MRRLRQPKPMRRSDSLAALVGAKPRPQLLADDRLPRPVRRRR